LYFCSVNGYLLAIRVSFPRGQAVYVTTHLKTTRWWSFIISAAKIGYFLLSSKDLAINFKTKRKETEADDFRFLFLSLGNRSMTCPLDSLVAQQFLRNPFAP